MPIQTPISGLNFIFFDDIPEESIKIKDMYDNITFSDNQYFYFHDEANDIDYFYSKFQDEIYRPLKIVELKNGSKCVFLKDSKGNRIILNIKKFKFYYGI